jgi:hypothetical protein
VKPGLRHAVRRGGAVVILGLALLCASAAVAGADEPQLDENGEPIEKEPEADPSSMLKTFGAYALVIVGFSVVGIAAVKTFASNQSYPQTKITLITFLRSNPHQVLAIAKSMKGTVTEPIAAALKTGGMMQSQDLKLIATGTLPTYDATAQGIVAMFGAVIGKAKLGVMAAIAGAAIGLSGGAILPLLIAVVAGLAFLRLYLFKTALESNILRARVEILPEVDQAVAAGRYYVPPAQ